MSEVRNISSIIHDIISSTINYMDKISDRKTPLYIRLQDNVNTIIHTYK